MSHGVSEIVQPIEVGDNVSWKRSDVSHQGELSLEREPLKDQMVEPPVTFRSPKICAIRSGKK
jgi:hypothetical protein